MLAEQRAELILSHLSEHRALSVADICRFTGASEATIRRDLNLLDEQRKLRKVHGGAVLIEDEFHIAEPDMAVKRELHAEEKRRIARFAASMVQDDDVVFLDAGTTVLEMAYFLRQSHALFVTNNMECAFRLAEGGAQPYMLGGDVDPKTMSTAGAQMMDALRHYNFTKAFLGVTGITVAQGFTTPDPEAASLKALAASRSARTYVLADASKFGKVTASTALPLEDAVIITDRPVDRRYSDVTGIEVVT